MRPIVLVRAARRATARRLGAATRLLVGRVAALAEHAQYRRRELAVVALLAATVVGGFAIEAWRRRAPTLLEWLEAEPSQGAGQARAFGDGAATAVRWRTPPASRPTPADPVDLNRATARDLMRLPGIGPRLAARILAQRHAMGGRFRSADELARVTGIGRRRLALLRPLVTAGAPHRGMEERIQNAREPP